MVKRLTTSPVPIPQPLTHRHAQFIVQEAHQRKFWICTIDALIQDWSTTLAQGNVRKKRESILGPIGPIRENRPRCHLSIRKLTSFHGLEWITGGARGQKCYSSRSPSTWKHEANGKKVPPIWGPHSTAQEFSRY